ncbi:cellulase family glycosylhydrolase [Nocardioides oceani]|nr:cellulase family glycosylhydrolase [Nocardioides oceani]
MRNRTLSTLLAPLVLALGLSVTLTAPASSLRPTTAASTSVTAPSEGYGFTDGMGILALSDADLDRTLDAVAATGGSWLRMPLPWALVERTQGSYDWTRTDRVVAEARERGLRVIGVVAYVPDWARTSDAPTAPPADPAAFGAFAGDLAEHYAGSVDTFEIWNEPNLAPFYGGQPDARSFTALLRAAYPAIKAVQPRSTVVLGGLSKARSDATAPNTFLGNVYKYGGRGFFDAVGFHPYVNATGYAADSQRVWQQVANLRATMVLRGDLLKQIWFTESGMSTWAGGYTAQQQADAAVDQLRKAAQASYVGPSILYSVRDSGVVPTDVGQNFGALMTHDWRAKPLAAVLAD